VEELVMRVGKTYKGNEWRELWNEMKIVRKVFWLLEQSLGGWDRGWDRGKSKFMSCVRYMPCGCIFKFW